MVFLKNKSKGDHESQLKSRNDLIEPKYLWESYFFPVFSSSLQFIDIYSWMMYESISIYFLPNLQTTLFTIYWFIFDCVVHMNWILSFFHSSVRSSVSLFVHHIALWTVTHYRQLLKGNIISIITQQAEVLQALVVRGTRLHKSHAAILNRQITNIWIPCRKQELKRRIVCLNSIHSKICRSELSEVNSK